METIEEKLAVWLEGVEIECSKNNTDCWSAVGPGWNWCVTDHRIKEQPKKKVKMWQWVYQIGSRPQIATSFYKTEEGFKNTFRSLLDFKFLKRADWTEIEVEE